MGGRNSRGDMVIACDKVTVSPGDDISGHIYIQLNKKVKVKVALFLVFVGKENVQWKNGIDSAKEGKNTFIKENVRVIDWEYGQKKGQYDIPFIFKLPENLYSTFSLEEEKFKARITYKLHAVLKIKKKILKTTVDLEILNKCNVERVPSRILKTFIVKRRFYRNTNFQIKAEIDKNMYYSNEDIVFDVAYDNSNSNLPLDSIVISLIRRITLKNNQGDATQTTKILNQVRLERIKAYEKQNEGYRGAFSLEQCSEIVSASRSLTTKFITCKYFVTISQAPISCCTMPLEDLEIELVILPGRSLFQKTIIEVPEDWNPERFPEARVDFNQIISI